MSDISNPESPRPIDRRRFLRNTGIGAAAAGVAWAAPAAIDSFTSPAWSAGGTALLNQSAYNATVISVAVRGGAAVSYDISGAGGGGGASTTNNVASNNVNQAAAGGAGTRLTGVIPAQPTPYTLYVAIGQRGNRGVIPGNPAEQDKGLSLYGSGGKGAGVLTSSGSRPGRGGGGGGATAISNSSDFNGSILVVAPYYYTSGNFDGGALTSGTTNGSVLAGVAGTMSGTTGSARSGAPGAGGTASVGVGGKSAAQQWGDPSNQGGGWPGFNGGDRDQNQSTGYTSSGYVLTRVSDGGGGGVGGHTSTDGWDGGAGGGGGGGYTGGGGGGGGKGDSSNGAGDGGSGGSGSAFAKGAGTATAAVGATGGARGANKSNGSEGTDGWVKLATL